MSEIERKMLEIAWHLNELNKQEKVKGFKGNEKGYAKMPFTFWENREKRKKC